MNGQKRYWNSIQSILGELFAHIVSGNKELYKVIENDLFDLSGPHRLPRDRSNSERQAAIVFQGYYEIISSYDNLADIEVYLKRLPSRKSNISKTRYIKYHIGNYLNEVYILENRLVSYATKMLRSSQYLDEYERLKKYKAPLIKGLHLSFKSINNLRGSHVHQYRFSDDDLDRASSWELIINTNSPSLGLDFSKLAPVKMMTHYSMRKARKKWLDYVKSNNEKIRNVLDIYFDALYLIVFDKDSKIRFAK
jgi:hypothetical protein